MAQTTRSIALLAALLAGAAGPAAADWLVTRDGARLETRGAWEVRGKTVVFKAMNGTLSSLSLAYVDLERSAELTAAGPPAAGPPAAGPPAERPAAPKVVRSIGPHDIPRARATFTASGSRDGAAGETTEAGGTPPGGTPPGGTPPGGAAAGRTAAFTDLLEVTSWEKNVPSWLDGVELVGRITNRSQSTATDLSITVRIFDENGRQLASQRAFLESPSLLRGQSLDFRLPFEGVADFATVQFDVSATEVVLGVGAIDTFTPPEGETGEAAATDESGS